MDDLTLVGVHEDGEHLLLVDGSGSRHRLKVDEALRAAVRRDRARLGQLQLESEGRLRPREIQARIRAGESAEEVSAAAGVPIEHVRRYEGPVLAEREFVASQARGVRVRRGAPGGNGGAVTGAPPLGEVVADRLSQREVDPDDAAWDAWRADDGSWCVVVRSPPAPSRARRAGPTTRRCGTSPRWTTRRAGSPRTSRAAAAAAPAVAGARPGVRRRGAGAHAPGAGGARRRRPARHAARAARPPARAGGGPTRTRSTRCARRSTR
jgi:hypothetical protein